MSKIEVGDKVRIIKESSVKRGSIGTVVWKGNRRTSGRDFSLQFEVKFKGDAKNRFYTVSGVELLTQHEIEDSGPKSFAVIAFNGESEHEFESGLVSKTEAATIARELQLLNPTMKFGIIQLLATTTKPRKVVDIEDYA